MEAESEDSVPKTNTEKALDAFADLETQIDVKIEEGVIKLHDDFEKFKHDIEILEESTVNRIFEKFEDILMSIEELRKSADELGLDLTTCTIPTNEDLQKFPDMVIDELRSCIAFKIESVRKVVEVGITNIGAFSKLVSRIRKQLRICKTNFNESEAEHLLNQIGTLITDLPAKIENEKTKVCRYIYNTGGDVNACVHHKLLSAGLNAHEVSNHLKCIKAKMEQHKNENIVEEENKDEH